jgi:putative transposase
VLKAIFFVLRSGCPWRMLPERFPPRQTVLRWFLLWRDRGLFEALTTAWSCWSVKDQA